MRGGKTGAAFLEGARGCFHARKHTKPQIAMAMPFAAAMRLKLARVSRAGERVVAIANFLSIARRLAKRPFREACFGTTPNQQASACATRIFARLLCAFLESGRFAAQMRENFAGEMK